MSTAADRLTHAEETIANEIEHDFAKLFERWSYKGHPKNFVVPTALLIALDEARRSGISFQSALETLQLIYRRKLS